MPTKPPSKPFKTLNGGRRDQLVDADDIGFDDDDFDFELPPLAAGEVVPDAKPNPVELPAPINPEGGKKHAVETHRNLFCQHYDHCLDEAVKKGWNSFTCLRCTLFKTSKDEYAGVERFATQRKGW